MCTIEKVSTETMQVASPALLYRRLHTSLDFFEWLWLNQTIILLRIKCLRFLCTVLHICNRVKSFERCLFHARHNLAKTWAARKVIYFVFFFLHFVTFSSQVSLWNSGYSPRGEHGSDVVAPTQDIGGIGHFWWWRKPECPEESTRTWSAPKIPFIRCNLHYIFFG
jgi:hypothetical protein